MASAEWPGRWCSCRCEHWETNFSPLHQVGAVRDGGYGWEMCSCRRSSCREEQGELCMGDVRELLLRHVVPRKQPQLWGQRLYVSQSWCRWMDRDVQELVQCHWARSGKCVTALAARCWLDEGCPPTAPNPSWPGAHAALCPTCSTWHGPGSWLFHAFPYPFMLLAICSCILHASNETN